MSPTKRALLIASPFGGLRGPPNDVGRMTRVLEARGFNITQRCGKNATRDGIRAAWQNIIDESSSEDTVVIFYSGHGGLVESRRKLETENNGDRSRPRQYQFLVPMDFNDTRDGDFRGILDIEIAHMLRDTTNKTANVTVILDCCHSDRMARDTTHGDNAIPKQLLDVQHHDIAKWIEILKQEGHLVGETAIEGNRDAVRIAASATRETAWEYLKDGRWGGIMTEALARALEETDGQDTSWRTLLIRVGELVHIEFPQQHLQAEGPDTRGCFSLIPKSSEAFHIIMENGTPVLRAGRVAGIREGNKYDIMPFGSTENDKRNQIAEATVTRVIGFKARVKLTFELAGGSLPEDGALAFLSQEALYEWPVKLPDGLPGLETAVTESRFLRRYNDREDPSYLVEFQHEAGKITLLTERGVQIASEQIPEDQTTSATAIGRTIRAAEMLAKAQHLLRLRCENPREVLNHGLEVEFGSVHKERGIRPIEQDGSGFITEEDRVYVSLHNTGTGTVYVSVFDVNIAGKIALLSSSSPEGLELKVGSAYTIGMDEFDDVLKGLSASWPESVPRSERVDERLIFVLSSAAVNLRHLESSAASTTRLGDLDSKRSSLQGLEEITYRLASGKRRDVTNNIRQYPERYDIFQIPFSMVGKSASIQVPAGQLRAPESTEEWEKPPTYPPHAAAKGIFHAGIRALQGIPSCVWVVNQHIEDIAVVVSKYRPNRLLSGLGLAASSTGGSVNYSTTTFLSPATTKVLAPPHDGHTRSMATFPLWTRKGGFGVISIFTGPEKKLFIENDRIPIGATVYFRNEPDLTIVGYGEKQVDIPLPQSPDPTSMFKQSDPRHNVFEISTAYQEEAYSVLIGKHGG